MLTAGADIKNSEKLALEAIDQIENKKYYQDFMYQNLVTNIYCYGICFTKKSCTVAFKDIKEVALNATLDTSLMIN